MARIMLIVHAEIDKVYRNRLVEVIMVALQDEPGQFLNVFRW